MIVLINNNIESMNYPNILNQHKRTQLLKVIFLLVPVILTMGFEGSNDSTGMKMLGYVKSKSSKEIKSSPWGIQAGSLDENILAKASEIGVKWTRLEANWSLIEKEKGKFDYSGTDKGFNAALDQGIIPFVTLDGTNTIYVKTRTDLDPKIIEVYGTHPLPPTSNPEAMNTWLNFVGKMVERYKDKIKYWEIWNEPNHFAYWGDEPNAEDYGRLVNLTAKIIKKTDPSAFVIAGALAGLDPAFTDAFLKYKNNPELVDIITFHNYGAIPEERIYKALETWDVINKINPNIKLWQGECGYPSHSSTRDYRGISPWGPTIHAKWLLRQSFTDTYFCRTSLSNYFKLFDSGNRAEKPVRSYLTKIDSVLGFPERGGNRVKVVGVNEKCLLENPDLKPKPGFQAYQNLCSVMNGNFSPVENRHEISIKDVGVFYGIGSADDAFPSIPLVATYKRENGNNITAYWLPWHPQEIIKPATIDFKIYNLKFKNPVLIDPINGEVYKLKQESGNPGDLILKNIPLTDYPMIIAEQEDIEINCK